MVLHPVPRDRTTNLPRRLPHGLASRSYMAWRLKDRLRWASGPGKRARCTRHPPDIVIDEPEQLQPRLSFREVGIDG